MPNLVPPVTTRNMALDYRQRILNALPEGSDFNPLMTLYLTNKTQPEEIRTARCAEIPAAKLYPAGATTHSDSAVSSIESLYPVFEAMSEVGMLLLVHGEVTDNEVDIFDREHRFIDQYMQPIRDRFPDLRIVFEHITTAEAANFVLEQPNMAATITPQHLLLNRNDMLAGGIRPHHYCLPVLKRNIHQQRLQEVATSGSPKFFLGTDSAPHLKHMKETACGCAGCYSAWSAIELYTQIFEELGSLDKLENFASGFGPDFYGLPRNNTTITLIKQDWVVPEVIDLPDHESIVPFFAGKTLAWQLKSL